MYFRGDCFNNDGFHRFLVSNKTLDVNLISQGSESGKEDQEEETGRTFLWGPVALTLPETNIAPENGWLEY